MKCMLCQSKQFTLVSDVLRDSTKHKIYECANCGHVQLFPRPTEKESKKFYDENEQDKLSGVSVGHDRLACDNQRRVELLSSMFPKDISILDVGAGYGYFVTAMMCAGFTNIIGQERSLARAAGDALTCEVGDIKSKYDVITLFHVIEHLVNPMKMLKQIKKLLKPGGILFVETPNLHERLREESPAYAAFYFIQSHLSFFNGRTLVEIMDCADFSNIKLRYVQRYSIINHDHWLTHGTPQMENPSFTVPFFMEHMDRNYRKQLIDSKRSDTLFVTGVAL